MTNVGYQPQAAVDALLNDPDMDKSALPGDEITITAVSYTHLDVYKRQALS